MRALSAAEIGEYLDDVRELVVKELERIVPRSRKYDADLFDLVRDYPFRPAKMLRPALAVAVCRAAGGQLEAILPTAAVLELFHNAFLIHDDVEDGSWFRRESPTLHRAHGPAIAINVGDAMLALCLPPLLDNTRLLGVGRALRVLSLVAEMSVESSKGQALELGWIRRGTWSLSERDYLRMVHQKTTWYTFLVPAALGAMIAGCASDMIARIRLWATLIGSAFQIQDDLLNLEEYGEGYGKEPAGDLWEGKRTLILITALARASRDDQNRAIAILAKNRPSDPEKAPSENDRTEDDIEFLKKLILRTDSLHHARQVARRRCQAATRRLENIATALDKSGATDSIHVAFLGGITHYVLSRVK